MTIDESLLTVLTDRQRELVQELCDHGQSQLFAHSTASTLPALVGQLEDLHATHNLVEYIQRARVLLANSQKGVNPLEGWEPFVPKGRSLQLSDDDFQKYEAVGRRCRPGFVLVAGGLGERLGYSSIKVGLPTQCTTQTCYLEYYISYIRAVGPDLPLCIMTSHDTNAATLALLRDNHYFGMRQDQITIVQQGHGVPALSDATAKMVLENNRIVTKPHGHGDVHALLYTHKVAQQWLEQQIDYIVFFQDTNGLAFHSLQAMLGVSVQDNLVVNSLTVPRKAQQAIGGIARLVHAQTQETKTINVEYNQLDPLLRASRDFPNGDVNDDTGYSPFPGNINQLVLHLKAYHQALVRTKGLMPEFVNPKYTDATKTTFTKPTRLECMMQDFPSVLLPDEPVGFTTLDARLCFSPVKNATAAGVVLQQKGTQPGTAATGEADQYQAFVLLLQALGCAVDVGENVVFDGIAIPSGPSIVVEPSVACSFTDYRKVFPQPSNIKISARSTLILRGRNIVVERLDLDGCLIVEGDGVTVDCAVTNRGWTKEAVADSPDEVIRMRGYRIVKHEQETITS